VRREIEAGRTPIHHSDAWLGRDSTDAPKRD
jgi:hypothetical protein